MPYEEEPFTERRIAVLNGVPGTLIKSAEALESDLKQISQDRWGLTLVGTSTSHQFTGDENPESPHEDGGTGVVIYAESHGAVSSWPRLKINDFKGHLQVDLTTCSKEPTLDHEFEKALLGMYRPQRLRSSLITRAPWGLEDADRVRLFRAIDQEMFPGAYELSELIAEYEQQSPVQMDDLLSLISLMSVGTRIPRGNWNKTKEETIIIPKYKIVS